MKNRLKECGLTTLETSGNISKGTVLIGYQEVLVLTEDNQ